MSEPKLISPMLDNFDMGGPISDHDGVRCCPAMRKNSDEKYIVKIISVPASQTKLDALLLTGAYTNTASALAYFKEQAEGIADEKKILDNLTQLEGFVPFVDCQIVPMSDAIGFDVYLLSEYRITLERKFARTPMTQLEAVNLGLDLCAALSVARRSGYLCIDLKPSNIYVTGDKEYKIGDLGYTRLSSLKYASLPDKYRSCYTAPELEEAIASLNKTMDIYAVGLILYQVFNGGVLPFTGDYAPKEPLAAPACADEEMASIILKACDPDPDQRWQDPVEMGQAIVSYMQKNSVNDIPLTRENFGADEPTEELDDEPQEVLSVEADTEEATAEDAADADVTEIQPEEAAVEPAIFAEIEAADDAEASSEITAAEETDSEPAPEAEVLEDQPLIDQEATEPEPVDAPQAEEAPAEDAANADEEFDNLSFLDDMDETSRQLLADMGDDYEGISDDVSDMLGQIDSLTSHEVPEPVVAPEPIEVTLPEPVEEEAPADEVTEVTDVSEEPAESDEDLPEEELPEEEMPYVPKKKRTGLIIGIILFILVALGVGGYFFYTMYYLQPIHALNLTGSEDQLVVELRADIDESALTLVCSDSHGNKVTAPVVGGTAMFTGLTPDTAYTVSVEVEGFHELTGVTSKVYSTPILSKVTQVRAITGSESGSVILNFAVEGPDSDQWNVYYNAEGEAERVTAFPSHMVTLAGLTVGKEYTFRLEPIDDIYIGGETEFTYVVRNLVCAENLHITVCADGILTAQWDTPEGEAVSEWTVRCYNETGYDETIVTEENTVTFQEVDDSVSNTIEVTAAEMSVNQRVSVAAKAITVSEFSVDTAKADKLTISWDANREVPESGWIIRYQVNGISAASQVTAKENSAKIPVVPGGSYTFTILDGLENPVLGGPFAHEQSGAKSFDAFNVDKDDITPRLCKTPSAANWDYNDLDDEDYVNSFASGEKVSMVLALAKTPKNSDSSILVTFAIYDEAGNLVNFAHDSESWKSMWDQNYCELDIPGIPSQAGTYNLIVFFDGAEAASQKFEITA